MRVYVFMNDRGEFICRNRQKISVSATEEDKILTFRQMNRAITELDNDYKWEQHGINRRDFAVVAADLSIMPSARR